MCRRSLFTALLFMFLAAWLAATPSYAKKSGDRLSRSHDHHRRNHYKYQVFVPDNWTSKKVWPIILSLHGAGERGDDGLVQTQVGIARAIRLDRDRFPAIVVIPQCRKEIWWAQSPMHDLAIKSLEAATKEFHGDTKSGVTSSDNSDTVDAPESQPGFSSAPQA